MSFLYVPGTNTTDFASTPDAAALDITASLQVVVRLRRSTGADNGSIAGKWLTTGNQRSWKIGYSFGDGGITFDWTTAGTSGSALSMFVTPASILLTQGDWFWLRVQFIADNGSSQRGLVVDYSADDTDDPGAVTWTSYGTSALVAGVTSIFSGTADLHVGAAGISGLPASYQVMELTADPFGTPNVVAYPRFADEPNGTTSFVDAEGLTWTVAGAAEIIGELVGTLGPIAATPFGSAPQMIPPRLHLVTPQVGASLRVLRPPDFDGVTDLDTLHGLAWQDKRNDMGEGQMTITRADPAAALIDRQDVLQFLEDSEILFASIVEEISEHTLDEQGQALEVNTYEGRGINRELGYTVIQPARGDHSLPKEQDRVGDWTSPQASRVGWVNSSEICSVDAAKGGLWPHQPMAENFPSGSGAQMIWAASGTLMQAPVGMCLFDDPFEITAAGLHVWVVIIDNLGFIRTDGQHLQDIDVRDGFTKATQIVVEYSTGDHNVSVFARNVGPDSIIAGPGAVAYALYKADQGRQITGDALVVSNSGTLMLPYPADVPGMTAGEFVRIVFYEGQNRGVTGVDCFPWLTPTFTDTHDTAGRPFPIIRGLSTKTDTPLPQLLQELVAAGHITQWRRDPGNTTFSMWGPDWVQTLPITVEPALVTDPRTGTLQFLDRRTN